MSPNKKMYFILIFCLAILKCYSQYTLTRQDKKFVFGIIINPAIVVQDDYINGEVNIRFRPQIQYFVNNKMSLFAGTDLGYGAGWGYQNPTKTKLFTFSTGARYYFFKKKWLFAELGYQNGKLYQYNLDSSYNTHINQLGLGMGIRFQLAQHPGIGRFTFEYILRINKSLGEIDRISDLSYAKTLGSGFGLHYYFDPTRPAQKEFTDKEKSLKTLHLIKVSMNPSIDYAFEKPLSKNLCLNNGIIFNNLTYLLEDTATLFAQINIEPRWYYGYVKRMERNQIVTNNSSDFLSIALLTTHPFSFVKTKNATMFTILPKWGLRRAIGKHIIFELGLGYGFSQAFYDKRWYYTSQPYFNYYLGYVF